LNAENAPKHSLVLLRHACIRTQTHTDTHTHIPHTRTHARTQACACAGDLLWVISGEEASIQWPGTGEEAAVPKAESVCYVCELAGTPGKFDPKKAKALGVPHPSVSPCSSCACLRDRQLCQTSRQTIQMALDRQLCLAKRQTIYMATDANTAGRDGRWCVLLLEWQGHGRAPPSVAFRGGSGDQHTVQGRTSTCAS